MIWILLPAYNEQGNLPQLMQKMQDALKGRDYRLVVVNDGSTDQTAEILNKTKGILNLEVVSSISPGGQNVMILLCALRVMTPMSPSTCLT